MSFDYQRLKSLVTEQYGQAMTDAQRRSFFLELKVLIHQEDQLNAARNLALDSLKELPSSQGVDWVEDFLKILEKVRDNLNVYGSQAAFSPGTDIRSLIIDHLRNCGQSAQICVFTISDDRITDAIIQAHRRDVHVQVISDNDKRHDHGNDLNLIKRAGIEVRFDKTRDHMHHKFAIFDHRILISGSFNWTRSATTRNYENVILTTDPHLLEPFKTEFENLWEDFGRK